MLKYYVKLQCTMKNYDRLTLIIYLKLLTYHNKIYLKFYINFLSFYTHLEHTFTSKKNITYKMSVANNKHEFSPKFANKIVNFTMNNFKEKQKQNKNTANSIEINEKNDAKMSYASNGKSVWPHILSKIIKNNGTTSLNLELKKILVND